MDMTKFVVIYKHEGKKTAAEDSVKNHVEHIRSLDNEGVLFLCGLFKDHEKAMLIIEAKSYDEAEAYILRDPLVVEKYYSYVIYELIEANKSNNFLL